MKRLSEKEMFEIHFRHEVIEVEYGHYQIEININEKENEK